MKSMNEDEYPQLVDDLQNCTCLSQHIRNHSDKTFLSIYKTAIRALIA